MKKSKKKLMLKISGAALLIVAASLTTLAVILIQPCDAYANNGFSKIDPRTQKLANTYINLWKNPSLRNQSLSELHRQNPEWDFMFRTYSVLSFANLALHDPQKQTEYLSLIDIIIDDTLRRETRNGFQYFLLGYGQGNNWKLRPPRSQFVDGEIALMLAVRCLIEDIPAYTAELKHRVALMINRMEKSPVRCAESYPDECWVFCNTISLVAIRISDRLCHTDHSAFLADWVRIAKEKLIDPKTGLLRSAFTLDGAPIASAKGPEGSSIWMACHWLQIIDEPFAREQYDIARKELLNSIFGFGYSREWPANFQGNPDIDSGPVLPVFGASPSASGLALCAAASFKDTDNFNKLTRSLNTLALPTETNDGLYYQLSNPLGDAVILYGLTAGPLWDKLNTTARTVD